MLVALVGASATFILLDLSRFPRFALARIVLALVFAAVAVASLARLHYVSAGDFSLIATATFLTGLFVDALVGDAIRAGMRQAP